MNWRRLGVALMLVGVLFGATGTYSAISIDADRGFDIGATGAADDVDGQDPNYFDGVDATTKYTTISSNPYGRVVRVFNHFGEPVRAEQVELVAIEPVNASRANTTTDSSAVSVISGDSNFDAGDTVGVDDQAVVSLTCSPSFNATVSGEHELTVSIVVQGVESGTEVSIDRTVTAPVECNV